MGEKSASLAEQGMVQIQQKRSKDTGIREHRKLQKYRQQLGHGRDIEVLKMMADLYRELGNSHAAVATYRAAIRRLTTGGKSLTIEQSDQFIALYRAILALSPCDHEAIEQLGREYQRRGMEYRAVAHYTAAAEQFGQRGEYMQAIACYQQVIALEPGSITARQACAYLYCHLSNYQQGAQAYLEIGNIYFEHRQFEGALQYYQYAANLDPDNPEIQEKQILTQQVLKGAFLFYPRSQGTPQRTPREVFVLERFCREFSRQQTQELHLSDKVRQSLQEIGTLLVTQEQAIHALAGL